MDQFFLSVFHRHQLSVWERECGEQIKLKTSEEALLIFESNSKFEISRSSQSQCFMLQALSGKENG